MKVKSQLILTSVVVSSVLLSIYLIPQKIGAVQERAAAQVAAQVAADARVVVDKEAARVAALTPGQRIAEIKAAAKYKRDQVRAAADYEKRQAKLAQAKALYYGQYGDMESQSMAQAIVKTYLGNAMNDPDSLQMGRCGPVKPTALGWVLMCEYRGKNSFGGLVLQHTVFFISHDQVTGTKNM